MPLCLGVRARVCVTDVLNVSIKKVPPILRTSVRRIWVGYKMQVEVGRIAKCVILSEVMRIEAL